MPFTPIQTQDGSITCHDPETGDLYHNSAGAYTEAFKNYVEPSQAIKRIKETGELRLLDVCFGLGYNTWVLLEEVLKTSLPPFSISILSIESDPEILKLIPSVLEDPRLNNLKNILDTSGHNIYYQTQNKGLEFTINIASHGRISFRLILGDLRAIVPCLKESFDLIFHDPFSPNKVPELWTVDLFREYHRLLEARKGSLFTYSLAGAVRGGLIESGFTLMRTTAVGKKSGGTFAGTSQDPNNSSLFSLTEAEACFLQTRAAIPYRDPGFSCLREEIVANRVDEQANSTLPSSKEYRKFLNQQNTTSVDLN